MSGMTAYVERLFLNALLLGMQPKLPEAVYVGLFLTPPSREGEGVEVSGLGYQRQAVVFDGLPLLGVYRNAAEVWFPDAETDWGKLGYFALFDAAKAGNMLVFGELERELRVTAGAAIHFEVGALAVMFAKKPN